MQRIAYLMHLRALTIVIRRNAVGFPTTAVSQVVPVDAGRPPSTTLEERMRAVARRIYDMGVRVVNWAGAHPDDEPGFGVLLARLQALVVRMGDVITAQRNGFIDTRAARSRKRELRSEMLAVPIAHLAQIGGLAAREGRELGETFRLRPA